MYIGISVLSILGITIIALLCLTPYIFYWWGWNKRNILINTYLDQKLKQSEELYKKEKEKNTQNIIRHSKNVIKLVDENKRSDLMITSLINRLNDYETEVIEYQKIIEAFKDEIHSFEEANKVKNERIEQLEKNQSYDSSYEVISD